MDLQVLLLMVYKEQNNCLIFRSAAKLTEVAVGRKQDTSTCKLTQLMQSTYKETMPF